MIKYQHIENKFSSPNVKGLLNNDVLIQPKLDGSNCQVYWENDQMVICSRNRVLSFENDNAECYKILTKDQNLINFFKNNPFIKLYGEWLVPHKVKYDEQYYKKFFIFDCVIKNSETEDGKCQYLAYETIYPALISNNLNAVPYIILNPTYLKNIQSNLFKEWKGFCNFLITDPEMEAEGIVIKNYNYKNIAGLSIWCKFINESFYQYENTHRPKENIIQDKSKEEEYLNNNNINYVLSKCLHKFENITIMNTGDYIKSCQQEFFDDYVDNDNLNIKFLKNLIAVKAKNYLNNYLEINVIK